MSCAAATIGAIVFSKGAPYRKPLYTNGIMMGWTVAAVATTIFLSLYESEDFRERMNMKISPDMTYRYKLIAIMFVDFAFCYIWEIYFLDGLLFAKVLPFYKEKFRGPHLPFELLEQELKSNHNWPPVNGSKNNETKIVMPRGAGTSKTLIDQQTQTPGDGVTVALRAQLKNATRNIKNRWSSSGADGRDVGGVVGSMNQSEEAQSLLSKGTSINEDETPTHQPNQPRPQIGHGGGHENHPNIAPPPYPLPVATIPPTSQLQRVINNTLQRSSESKMLSETIC
jgi:hypothetical protein